MSNSTIIVYSGDDTANVLTEAQRNQALEALIAARPFVYPKTGERMDRVLDFATVTEKSKAIIAALICSESDLYGTDGLTERLQPHSGLQKALGACGYRLVDPDRRIWLPMDIFVIAVPDSLDYYNFPPELDGMIEAIDEIRFFDKNAITHICSTEGSYWTQFLEMRVELNPDFADNYELRERAYDWVNEANREAETGDDYLDERMVDRILELNAPGTVHHYGNPGISWEDALDEAQNTAGHAIRSIRKAKNYWLKEKGEELLPVDEATIGKLVDERFADKAQAGKDMERAIFQHVREYLQGNSML